MKLQQHIQTWLGITQLYNRIDYLDNKLTNAQREITNLKQIKEAVSIHNRALGRFIAKLDPLFASNEFDPERKAESDHLADVVIERLKAEHLALRNLNDV